MNGGKITSAIAATIIKMAILVIAVIAIYRLAVSAYDFGYRVFAEPAMSSEPGVTINVSIADDMNSRDVGKLLEGKGLIRDANLFFVQELVSEYKDKVQPGEYELTTAMTVDEMLATLSEGYTEETITEAEMESEVESEVETE